MDNNKIVNTDHEKIDPEQIKKAATQILEAAKNNQHYRNDPEKQLNGLGSIVSDLIDQKEKNDKLDCDALIAFLYYVGKSLRELIEYRKSNKQ